MKQKNITIREEQDNWIKQNHINLSSLVREAIENKREQH
jgi:post-segregation antitoxin (ccd killing protein)